MLQRIARFTVAALLSAVVILLCGPVLLVFGLVNIFAFPLLIWLDLPSPLAVVGVLWAWSLTKIQSWLLYMRLRVIGSVNLDPKRPVLCVCNHPPTAFFPMITWVIMAHIRVWVVCVSKVENLWNPFLGPLVIMPAMLAKMLILTTRGDGRGAQIIERLTKLLVSRHNALFLFADAHRPGSSKAIADLKKMRSIVPTLRLHRRLGAYRWAGVLAALEALGPDVQVVFVTFAFPSDAVGFKAPWRAWKQELVFKIEDKTKEVHAAASAHKQGERPTRLIGLMNQIALHEDGWASSLHPAD